MTTARFEASECPSCGYQFDAATATRGDATPEVGDVTLCLACGEVLVFDERMIPVKPTPKQLIELQLSTAWPDVQRAAKAIRYGRATVKGWPQGSV